MIVWLADSRNVNAVRHVESADGTPIAYRASGSGDPIVFVHGAATSGADGVFLAPFMRDRFTFVTMDRRGRGGSGDAPEHSIDREAEDVLAVLDEVGAELLVGHSYGALCSVLAAQRTDRLRRLVLYEPPIGLTHERLRGLDDRIEADERDKALERFLRVAGAPADQLAAIRASPAWAVLLDAVPALPRELRACADWRNPAGPIEVPLLFLLGSETTSPSYLDGLDELLAAFPDVRRESLPGEMHIGHVFAAELFARLVTEFCEG